MKKRLSLIVAGAMAMMLVLGTLTPARAITLKFSNWSISTQSWGAANNDFLDKIQKRTKNKVTFQRFWLGSLIPARKEVDGIGKGVADIASVFSPFVRSRLSLIDVGMLPATAESVDTFGADLLKLYKRVPAIGKQFEKWNLRFIAMLGGDPAYIISRVPIRKLADLEGKKIRVLGAGARVLKKLGVVPVGLASAECYEALERGTIDGVVMPSVGITMWKLHEAGKYLTHLPIYCNEFYFIMNKDKWNSIPAKLQKQIESVSGEWAIRNIYAKNWDAGDGAAIKDMGIKPEQLLSYSDAEWAKAVEIGQSLWPGYIEKWEAEGKPAQKVFDEPVKFLKAYR